MHDRTDAFCTTRGVWAKPSLAIRLLAGDKYRRMNEPLPAKRLRDLGITTGTLPTGLWNAITDVPGVRVGYASLAQNTPYVVRTGVTAVWPRGPELWVSIVLQVCTASMAAAR